MTKSVLILGAGLMQEPAILAAKKLGFKTFVIDANPNAQSVPLADVFKQIDLKDKEEILIYAGELFHKENLCGVFTAGTDFSVSVSYVASSLKLPCHDYEAALNASIKPRMRKCFEQASVPSPKYFSLTGKDFSYEKISFITESLGYPCVVKPADNMGARGCRMIRNKSEAFTASKIACENSKSQTIIIEEFMQGPEYSIDALVYNGTMTITGFADRHIYYPPYFIETGHTMPSTVDWKIKKELIECFALGVKALGLTCGAAKADIKYTKNGPQIGEIAARLSGGYMSGWTYPYSSDLNLTEQALLIATGHEPKQLLSKRIHIAASNEAFELYEVPSKKVSAERAWISIPGKIKNIEGIENALRVKNIENVFPRSVHAGDDIDFPRNNVQKCGNAISLSKDYNQAVKAAENACSKMIIRLEANNLMTEDFLNNGQEEDEKGFPPNAYSNYEKICELDLQGTIPANKSILKDIEPFIYELLDTPQKDWNYLTALETCRRFDLYMPNHPELPKARFWKALFKGGLQAAIYVSDSCADI